jgi:glycosyltransferase involved in cell wall biosynthesis
MDQIVVLDATPLDTGHRTRGIGRYVQGLLEGFAALRARGELAVALRALRAVGGVEAGRSEGFEEVRYPRRVMGGATWMYLENRARLDGYLPADAALYHGTAMEGVCRTRPWVATCHDLIPLLLRGPYLKPWNVSARWFWRDYARRLTGRADGLRQVVATSAHVKQTLVERFGLEAARVHVIHHGLSPFWLEAPTTEGVSAQAQAAAAGEPFVLFVGGFDPRKNLATLLRALSIIPRSQRPRLVLAGVCGETVRGEVEDAARRWGLRVTFAGYVGDRDLRWLYHRARCLAFPSVEEGWGFPIVEAMAVGTPVVCAGWGSMVEAAGGAAITTDVKRFEDLSHSLRVALTSEATRQERVAAGKARARALTWEAYARRLQGVYALALGEG